MLEKKKIFFENFKLSVITIKKVKLFFIYKKFFFVIIKHNNTLLKKNSNFFGVFLQNEKIFFFKKNKNIHPEPKNENFFKKVQIFLRQLYLYNFCKIKFTGKGYKIKKKKNLFSFLFNRSHRTKIWFFGFFFKKFKKYKIYIQSSQKLYKSINDTLKIRYVNIFTKRGLRLVRQKIFKKKGKK